MARQSFPEHQLALLLWRRSMTVAEIGRRSQSVATMRKKINLAILTSLAAICFAAGQESPSSTPAGSPTPEQTPLPSPSASAVRTVQLRFVPPPMEGTISLGIFDSNDKLVRVLHRVSNIDKMMAFDCGFFELK